MSQSSRAWFAILAVSSLALFAVVGMQPAPAAPAPVAPADMSFRTVCDAYRATPSDALAAEIARRHELTPDEFGAVRVGQVFIGMTWRGLECSRGMPQRQHSTETRYGVTDWYSYATPRLLVRLDDGKVVSISD